MNTTTSSKETHVNPDQVMLYQLGGRPKFRYAYPVALQHLLAMFISNLTPILIIGGAAGVTPEQLILMLQSAAVMSGIVTLMNVYPIKLGPIRIGAGLPIVMGTSMTFVAPATAVAALAIANGYSNPIGIILGGLIAAASAELFVGVFYKYLKRLFPPLVIGPILVSLGIMLLGSGVNNLAGGSPATNPDFGSAQNLALGFSVFFIHVILSRYGKGMWKVSSLLIAVAFGYIVGGFMGLVDLSGVRDASLFAFPTPWALRPEFHLWAIASFIVVYIISGLSTIGYTSTVTVAAFDRDATIEETSGALNCDAIGSALACSFNGLPNTEFGQNAAIVATTKIINKWCIALCAFTLILSGLFPPLAAVFGAIPPPVLGGAVLSVFAMIINNGILMIAKAGFSERNLLVLGVTFAIGLGFVGQQAAFAGLPGWLHFIFSDRVALIAFVGIIMNLVLPKTRADKEAEAKEREKEAAL